MGARRFPGAPRCGRTPVPGCDTDRVIVGLLLAFGAALATGAASVMQSVAVHRSGARGGGASALTGLARQPLYFIGLALDGIGFLGALLALRFLPLFVVQAVLAASVGVTAVIAVIMGSRLPRIGWLALAVTGAGLVLLSLSAAPGSGDPLPTVWRWVLFATFLPVVASGVRGRRFGRRTAPVLAFAAGFGFAAVAIAARSLQVPDPWWRMVFDPTFWTIIVSGAAALVVFAMALQSGSVTSVSAISFATDTLIPAAVGLAFLGDTVRSGYDVAAASGFVLALAGAVVLARFSGEQHGTSNPDPVRDADQDDQDGVNQERVSRW